MKLTVNLGKDSYPIYIENNILSQAASYISEVFTGRRIIIISDDHVYPLYGSPLLKALSEQYECHQLVLPHGEATKSFKSLPAIYTAMLQFSTRSTAGSDSPLPSCTGRLFRRRKSRRRPATGQEPGRRVLSAFNGPDRSNGVRYAE